MPINIPREALEEFARGVKRKFALFYIGDIGGESIPYDAADLVEDLEKFLASSAVTVVEKTAFDPRFNQTTSKREMFAAIALAGLLAQGDPAGGLTEIDVPLAMEDVALGAILAADKLITELNGDYGK
jgi:hypothetical protein